MDIEYVRKHFPALDRDFVFMDNAGGSQVLERVMDRITAYLKNYNVQLGASYKVSEEAGQRLAYATKSVAKLINARRTEEVVMGSSTTMLLRLLSLSISGNWSTGDEIIVTSSDHEANVSPWTALEEKGFKIKVWKINPETFNLEIEDLEKLLNPKTKLVAVTHCSNILGTINPIKKIAKVVHNNGSLICVDGVAYAPHRKIDVQDLDADFYTFSWYKTYGPHLAVMYGKYDLLKELDSLNHYFIGKDVVPYKLQPGNFNFELTYGTLGIIEYFENLAERHSKRSFSGSSEKIDFAFEVIAKHEEELATHLLQYLKTVPEITMIGHTEGSRELRVPTISFVHQKFKSDEIVSLVDDFQIGIRFGDFYAKKLIQQLGLEEKNGVVRVSLVHYNTKEEVQKLISVLKKIFNN